MKSGATIFLTLIFLITYNNALTAQNTKSSKRSAAAEIMKIINSSGIDKAREFVAENKTNTTHYYFSEHELNSMGYQLIEEARLSDAVAVFELNVELFPRSINVHDSLGEAYLYCGNTKKAIKHYGMIQKLNPMNRSGEAIIRNIRTECTKRQYMKLSKLLKAIIKGDKPLTAAWIDTCPELLNQRNKEGDVALHLAVCRAHEDIAEYLISCGADLNIRNRLGQTPYNIAEKGNLVTIKELLINNGADESPQQFPLLTSRYLGQEVPGLKPRIFAPGIVSTHAGVYGNIVFSPDFKEACWTLNDQNALYPSGGFIRSEYKDGKWCPLSGIKHLSDEYNQRSPFYSYNGKRLYFQGHLRSDQGRDQYEKFYFVDKKQGSWSEPQLVDSIFNKYSIHWQFSVDKDNNFYFGGKLRDKKNTGGIYISHFDEGKYSEPELIFSNDKLQDYVFAPAISPDGSYMIFIRVYPRGSKIPRIFSLYVSFRNRDGEWNDPQDVGELLGMDSNQPRISPDGKYIFYTGNDSRSYWVDAGILDSLKDIN